jgi:probable HAF family extracellular repeat protein
MLFRVFSALLVLAVCSAPSTTRAFQSLGTELVCVGLGGDGLTLAEWTAEQINELEARSGRPVTRANPQTGSCVEPSGLPVEAGGVEWVDFVCQQDGEGSWYGPIWVFKIYEAPSAIPPDPSSGGCPTPTAFPNLFAAQSELERAAAIAAYLSLLEARGEYDVLHQWMHPDSQSLVSSDVVANWYANEWAPRGPDLIHVERVALVDWTWGVTGKHYPSTAEITFRQAFADGTEIKDVVRLVRDDGVWRWFFGRDRDFIDAVNAQYGDGEASQVVAVPAYSITDLGTGQGDWSAARALNNLGDVLWTWGTALDANHGLITDAQQVLRIASRDQTLEVQSPIALNDSGTVLVSQGSRGLLLDPAVGILEPIPMFESDGWPADLNDAGVVTGHSGSQALVVGDQGAKVLPIPNGYGYAFPTAINNSGDVAGRVQLSRTDDSDQRAVLYDTSAVMVLDGAPGASTSSATDLNDSGQVVGHAGRVGMHSIQLPGRAFVYDANTGRMIDLGTLPGDTISGALAINNSGQVVGFSWRPIEGLPAIRRAFVYDLSTETMLDLNTLIPAESGWELLEARDINDAGQIVGEGRINGETHAFLLSPIGLN